MFYLFKKTDLKVYGSALSLLMLFTACNGGGGASGYGTPTQANTAQANLLATGNSAGSGTTKSTTGSGSSGTLTPAGSSVGAGTGTSTPAQAPTRDGDPVIQADLHGVGYNSALGADNQEATVQARNILKVQFAPGLPEPGKNEYSKLLVYIKVGTNLQHQTAVLSNGYNDGSPQKSAIFDFSSAIPKTCDSNDSACRETVKITVFKPNYDFCDSKIPYFNGCKGGTLQFLDGSAFVNYYQVYHVQDGHLWFGSLLIETDDTTELTAQ